MSTIFLQQILSDRLLLVVMGEQQKKKILNYRFKLKLITTYHL